MHTTQFQSTPPRGRRQLDNAIVSRLTPRFNPRLHAGGDMTTTNPNQITEKGFNPRLHAGGDSVIAPGQTKKWMFQSTPPRGRRR